MRFSKTALLILTVCIPGCVGKVDYTPPSQIADISGAKTIAKTKDQIWAELIPALSSKFFVVNTVDKASGLVNVSYSGDPEAYVDCGGVHSHVEKARGVRDYNFPAARATASYEALTNGQLFGIQRHVELEGRINIVISDAGPGNSIARANIRYVLTITSNITSVTGDTGTKVHTISFSTGEVGTGETISCHATGALERSVLDLIK